MQTSKNKEILHTLCFLSATADVLQSTLKAAVDIQNIPLGQLQLSIKPIYPNINLVINKMSVLAIEK